MILLLNHIKPVLAKHDSAVDSVSCYYYYLLQCFSSSLQQFWLFTEPRAMIHVFILFYKAKRARTWLVMNLLMNVMIIMVAKYV